MKLKTLEKKIMCKVKSLSITEYKIFESVFKDLNNESFYDYALLAYMIRDLDITDKANLKDLCFAYTSDGYISRNDLIFLLEMFYKYFYK